jgi:tRNA(His) 5'-end guanylyltransferase
MVTKKLDDRMSLFETLNDHSVLPGIFIVARLDGRNFTKLTKEVHKFKAPFDERFRDYMVATVQHLMGCGFKIAYGYTQSDEISLLFHFDEDTFKRKARKINSILAGEASAKFTLLSGVLASFDCRISELPLVSDVIDYFVWRQEDATRNALNGYCYWTLREKGMTGRQANKALLEKTRAQKNELLFEHGINFNEVPTWQKRGIGFFTNTIKKEGWNPIT